MFAIDLSIDPMLKSEISNALKSMGQPNVLCQGLSKPFLVLTGQRLTRLTKIDKIDQDQHQILTSKIDQDGCQKILQLFHHF